jgi:hypothetical protein
MEDPRNKKIDQDRWKIDKDRYQLSRPMNINRKIMSIGDIVSDVALDIEKPIQESIKTLRSVWPKLVGSPISLHSEPGFIKDNVLYIFVKQAGWLSELERIRGVILKKIENHYMEMNIQNIHFELTK